MGIGNRISKAHKLKLGGKSANSSKSSKQSTAIVDLTGGDNNVDGGTTLADINLQAKQLEKKYGVKLKLLNERGPGGGWPEYEVKGPKKNVERALKNITGEDDVEYLMGKEE